MKMFVAFTLNGEHSIRAFKKLKKSTNRKQKVKLPILPQILAFDIRVTRYFCPHFLFRYIE